MKAGVAPTLVAIDSAFLPTKASLCSRPLCRKLDGQWGETLVGCLDRAVTQIHPLVRPSTYRVTSRVESIRFTRAVANIRMQQFTQALRLCVLLTELAQSEERTAVVRGHDDGLVRVVARHIKPLVTNIGVDHFLPDACLGKGDGDGAGAVREIQQDHNKLFD
jgi:hypothetical protein